jgi:hypothetical protein
MNWDIWVFVHSKKYKLSGWGLRWSSIFSFEGEGACPLMIGYRDYANYTSGRNLAPHRFT